MFVDYVVLSHFTPRGKSAASGAVGESRLLGHSSDCLAWVLRVALHRVFLAIDRKSLASLSRAPCVLTCFDGGRVDDFIVALAEIGTQE